MQDIHTISMQLRELEDQLVVCMRCGLCQAVCPVFAQTGREADVARGKLALLDGLAEAMIHDAEGVRDRLSKCLLCGSCAANCPSGVDVLTIFMKARGILGGYLGLSPAKKMIFRGLLAHPERLDRLLRWGRRLQALALRPVDTMPGASCARFPLPFLGVRHVRAPAAAAYHERVPRLDLPETGAGIRVALFVGCLIDKVFPEIAEATVDVLRHHGVGIWMPDGQACCGIPAVSGGDLETFRRLVRMNTIAFGRGTFDYLVTACATCTSTIRHVWPTLLADAPAEERAAATAMAESAMDIHQFLVRHVALPEPRGVADTDIPVSYHDPCHLKKSLGVSAEPRRIIASSRGYRLKEMADADACCGMGGSFNLQYYGVSSSIGELKRQSVVESGCRVVATGCPACMMQLIDVLSRAGDPVAVRHPIQLYAQSMG